MARPCNNVPHEYQLDGSPNGPFDCGRAGAVRLVDHGSRGIYRPSTEEIGRRMGNRTGTSTVIDRKRAVESYDKEMRKKGYKPLKYKVAGAMTSSGIILRGGSKSALVNGLKRGDMADVVIDYGKLHRIDPHLARWTDFRGKHTITAGGKGRKGRILVRKRRGKLEVLVGDSIARRNAWWPVSTLWKAADGQWSSRGGRGWAGGFVACARPLKPSGPAPEQVDEVADELLGARSRVVELETIVGEADDLITMLGDRRLTPAIRVAIADLRGRIEATMPADVGQRPQQGEGDEEA